MTTFLKCTCAHYNIVLEYSKFLGIGRFFLHVVIYWEVLFMCSLLERFVYVLFCSGGFCLRVNMYRDVLSFVLGGFIYRLYI